MAQTGSLSLQDRSRFVRLITELSANKPNSADYNLAERLGHFIGVSGSMNLARGLRSLPVGAGSRSLSDSTVVRANAMSARESMIRNIVDSFSPCATESQTTLPSIATGVRAEALKTFEPYQRFYTTHQIEMAISIKTVREQLRRSMSGLSAQLHRLAELDKTLDDSLELHTRKQFNIAPKVLEQRFKVLLQQQPEVEKDAVDYLAGADDWLDLFYSEMRELLLAELDVRLQPVFGLLEALNEYEDTTL